MKNPVDYEAGWTKRVVNPATGRESFGGAARNHRIGRLGGADAVYTAGATEALNEIAPLVEQLQDRLQQSETFSVELIRRLEAIDQAAARRRR
jgi:hypothetical protein